MSEQQHYFGDVLSDYQNGVRLDTRVKLAVDFLKSPMAAEVVKQHAADTAGLDDSPRYLAAWSLDLAQQLFDLAQGRELIKPLPQDDELTVANRRHIRRQIRGQVYAQFAGQEITREEAPAVVTGAPAINGGRLG